MSSVNPSNFSAILATASAGMIRCRIWSDSDFLIAALSIFRSASPTRVIERPLRPARAVRPTRCTYCASWPGMS